MERLAELGWIDKLVGLVAGIVAAAVVGKRFADIVVGLVGVQMFGSIEVGK